MGKMETVRNIRGDIVGYLDDDGCCIRAKDTKFETLATYAKNNNTTYDNKMNQVAKGDVTRSYIRY